MTGKKTGEKDGRKRREKKTARHEEKMKKKQPRPLMHTTEPSAIKYGTASDPQSSHTRALLLSDPVTTCRLSGVTQTEDT